MSALPMALLLGGCSAVPAPHPHWEILDTPGTASLRGVCAPARGVCWASGSSGTWLRTVDGGATWETGTVAGSADLDFRDVHAFDRDRALLVSAGQPARIYRTEDGGRSWSLVHESPHPTAFFDAMVFWDLHRGMVFSDPVGGRFLLLGTEDGGRTWRELETADLPAPLPGEGGFAASGTMMAALPPDHLWIATSHHGRILAREGGGAGWHVTVPPMARGTASRGVFSLAFRDPLWGVAVGGDYQTAEARDQTAAWTDDGGRTWHPCEQAPPGGYRSGAAFQPGTGRVVAVGRNGSDWSADGGRTWRPFGTERYHGVTFAPGGEGWSVGPAGRVARLRW